MDQLANTFSRLRRQRRKALIPFIMGGDPDLSTTRDLLLALDEAGADVIEVGIPFSDPLADGPIIQASSSRALSRGTTPEAVLRTIASVAGRLKAPVVALCYWNPVVQYGRNGVPGRSADARSKTGLASALRGPGSPGSTSPAAFVHAAKAHGLAGLIVPDLPLEESAALRAVTAKHGVSAVLLAAPTSPPERLRHIARASQGFIYYVSVTGTTGVRQALPPTLVHGVRQLKLISSKPVCVGFGISTPAQARTVARIADGVIVGSALVREIAAGRSRADRLRRARRFVGQLRRAV
jgi:tryptophan synthase alpha chain